MLPLTCSPIFKTIHSLLETWHHPRAVFYIKASHAKDHYSLASKHDTRGYKQTFNSLEGTCKYAEFLDFLCSGLMGNVVQSWMELAGP